MKFNPAELLQRKNDRQKRAKKDYPEEMMDNEAKEVRQGRPLVSKSYVF